MNKVSQLPQTLFLDRDGVINVRMPGEYVREVRQFVFLEKVPEAIALLANYFDYVFVVTNQAGVGKGLMTPSQLIDIHTFMMKHIESAGGRIDAIFTCQHAKTAACGCRKPDTGMALQAQQQFPSVAFSNAWMVGDSATDMIFGKNLSMKTALIHGKCEDAVALADLEIDWEGNSLWEFANFVKSNFTK